VRVFERKLASAKDYRNSPRIARVRELILAVVRDARMPRDFTARPAWFRAAVSSFLMFVALSESSRVSSGFRACPQRVESSISRKSFPVVRANFPARGADPGNLALSLARRCVSHGRNSK
jgi:hypothetical protein